MNVKEYIASGILEAYVLGGLDDKEIREVEEMAARFPEVREEITSLQESFGSFVEASAQIPPPNVKEKLLARLDDRTVPALKEASVHRIAYYKYATAASVALMLLCGSMAFYFWSKWQGAEARLVSLEEQTNRYADQINKANYRAGQLAGMVDVVKDTSVVKVTMKGVASSPGSLAIVFWNKHTNEVFVDPGNLPKAPEGMQYQLWALHDGQPVDAGVFETGEAGLYKVKPIQAAQAYAVTLEKKGGSPTPTLTAMHVFGNV